MSDGGRAPSSAGEKRNVLFVGAGQAAVQAAFGARRLGFQGRLTLLDADPAAPYQRPPLSKSYLLGDSAPPYLRPSASYAHDQIELHGSTAVAGIDRAGRKVQCADGAEFAYDQLVIATGAEPRTVLGAPAAENIVALRTLADADRLSELSRTAHRAVVVGGGFLGLEVAASLSSLGLAVTVIEASQELLARSASPAVATYLQRKHEEAGTNVLTATTVDEWHLDVEGALRAVTLSSGDTIAADFAVLAVGVTPRAALAEQNGLATRDGIVVDEFLLTEDRRIAAIGDCARVLLPDGRTWRHESVQNALEHGRAIGRWIATGEPTAVKAVPWFWSDQGENRLQIAGLLPSVRSNASLVVVGRPEVGSFSVAHRVGDLVVAVESVNAPEDHKAARRFLADERARSRAVPAERLRADGIVRALDLAGPELVGAVSSPPAMRRPTPTIGTDHVVVEKEGLT